MRPELEITEKIEKYLLGELQGEELKQFEKELAQNAALQHELELQQLLMDGVVVSGLKKELNEIHYSQYDSWRTFVIRNWWKFGVGVLLIGLGLFYFLKENKSSQKQILPIVMKEKENRRQPQKADFSEEELLLTERNQKDEPYLEEKEESSASFLKGFIEKLPSRIFKLTPIRDTLILLTDGSKILVPSYAFTDERGNTVMDKFSFSIKEVSKKSDILLNDLAEEGYEIVGGVYLEAVQKEKKLRLAKDKTMKVQFAYEPPVHVYLPDTKPIVNKESDKSEQIYFKVFDAHQERRIIILPAIVLDYDIIYTRKSNDPIVNERIESLLLPQYENSFTSTTQFHYRIEGSLLYGEGSELLDIYLANTNLKLWQADSLVENFLIKKAETDCEHYGQFMKAAEYFRWLKSLRHGKPERIHQLDYRNYRKGQLYNKLPDKVLEKYLLEAGLSGAESSELIDYFKKMFFFKKMFLRQTRFADTQKTGGSLDYYYSSEGRFIGFEKKCDSENRKKYMVEVGGKVVSAKELNSFIPLKNLGWVSNERFADYRNPANLSIYFKGADTALFAKAYIVFKEYNMVMGGKWTYNAENYFDKLPSQVDIYVVVIGYAGGKIYKGMQEIKTGEKTQVELNMKEISEEKLVKELRLLDQ